ncbi:division/cell wall cluster transcriptional repressor MraZ [Candidatus Beckwithbacteria bacterium]|nr:division/cell wall cluster transcriptional repressor MraZ [Candidatus Beckwithbacteria bacterium]
MFLGNFESNVDKTKGRVAIPRVFGREIGTKAILTKGYENSLLLVKFEDWQEITNQVVGKSFLSGLSRQTDRFLLGNAFEISFDKQGRFIIPAALRSYAQLAEEAVFVGVGNRIEIWSKQAWNKNETYLNENISQISESLNDKLGNQ